MINVFLGGGIKLLGNSKVTKSQRSNKSGKPMENERESAREK